MTLFPTDRSKWVLDIPFPIGVPCFSIDEFGTLKPLTNSYPESFTGKSALRILSVSMFILDSETSNILRELWVHRCGH